MSKCVGDGRHGWFVINTHQNRESIAVENLKRQGYSVYCPVVSKTVRHARKSKVVHRPLFPAYIFVEANPSSAQWRPMMSTVGVRTVIRMGGGPAQIPDEFVDSLQAREVDGLIALPSTPFEVGQKIRLKGGPMEGIVADIIELRDSDRVVVLMDLLRQPVKVQVSADMIVPA